MDPGHSEIYKAHPWEQRQLCNQFHCANCKAYNDPIDIPTTIVSQSWSSPISFLCIWRVFNPENRVSISTSSWPRKNPKTFMADMKAHSSSFWFHLFHKWLPGEKGRRKIQALSLSLSYVSALLFDKISMKGGKKASRGVGGFQEMQNPDKRHGLRWKKEEKKKTQKDKQEFAPRSWLWSVHFNQHTR